MRQRRRRPECPGCRNDRRLRIARYLLLTLLVAAMPCTCLTAMVAVDPGPAGDDHGFISPCEAARAAGVCCRVEDLPPGAPRPSAEECWQRQQAYSRRRWHRHYADQRAARRCLGGFAGVVAIAALTITAARRRRFALAAQTIGHVYRASVHDPRCARHGGPGTAA